MERLRFHLSHKPQPEKEEKQKFLEDLKFLKKILRMIEQRATGYDLAYEVEKNQAMKKLIYDGVMFYSTFQNIGNQVFIEAPDKTRVDYKSFRTVEDTEKYLFMVWLKDAIANLERILGPSNEYAKYKEGKKSKITLCKNCGEKIRSKTQKYCEMCGSELY
jgi:hypothetical protein